MIRQLDLTDENVNKAVRSGLHQAADKIMKAQKQLIAGKSQRLANAVTKSSIYVTKKGVVGVSIGYHSSAFKTDQNGFNAGIVGTVFEFGRPGKRGNTMKQNRNGKIYTVKKGVIQPHPHIRRGFHNAAPQACQAVIDAIQNEIDKMGDN